jgi:hypothetical protein
MSSAFNYSAKFDCYVMKIIKLPSKIPLHHLIIKMKDFLSFKLEFGFRGTFRDARF